MNAENTTPLFTAVVEITNKCNLRCPHCASDSGCAREDEMSLDELCGVVKDLASLARLPGVHDAGRWPLVEIWRDPKSFPHIRNKSAQLTGKCAKCPFGEICKAGCSAMAISQTGPSPKPRSASASWSRKKSSRK